MERTRPRRHPAGRPTARGRVRPPKRRDIPLVVAGAGPLSFGELTPPGAGPLELEIGCGKGTFLVEAARRRPEVRFVGIEAGYAYAAYTADRLARAGLGNAVVVADDARLFLADSAPAGAFERIHVYFPDPHPKRRHRKRRLFQPEIAARLARALKPGGELLVATDQSAYFGEITAVLGACPALRRAPDLEARYGPEQPGLAFGPTNYGRKARAAGRTIRRAVYVARPADEPIP